MGHRAVAGRRPRVLRAAPRAQGGDRRLRGGPARAVGRPAAARAPPPSRSPAARPHPSERPVRTRCRGRHDGCGGGSGAEGGCRRGASARRGPGARGMTPKPRLVPLVPRISTMPSSRRRWRLPGPSAEGGRRQPRRTARAASAREVRVAGALVAERGEPVDRRRARRSLGAGEVWLSPELSEQQIRSVRRRRHCTARDRGFRTAGAHGDRALRADGGRGVRPELPGCARRARTRWLQDRKGYRFPVVTDVTGRTHVYNSVPLDLVPRLAEVLATGVASLRVDLHTESPAEAGAAVAQGAARAGSAEAGMASDGAAAEHGADDRRPLLQGRDLGLDPALRDRRPMRSELVDVTSAWPRSAVPWCR